MPSVTQFVGLNTGMTQLLAIVIQFVNRKHGPQKGGQGPPQLIRSHPSCVCLYARFDTITYSQHHAGIWDLVGREGEEGVDWSPQLILQHTITDVVGWTEPSSLRLNCNSRAMPFHHSYPMMKAIMRSLAPVESQRLFNFSVLRCWAIGVRWLGKRSTLSAAR